MSTEIIFIAKRCHECGLMFSLDCFYSTSKRYSSFDNYCKGCRIVYAKESRIRLKLRVFSDLGGECACCGETEVEFLTVHHVEKDGKPHRAKIGDAGIYLDILRQGCPKDKYEVLCSNCHNSISWF